MTLLRGFTYVSISCGVCGSNYICFETTDDPETVKLSCWNGHSAEVPRDDPKVKEALEDAEDDLIACPAVDCDVKVPSDDLQAQMSHMEHAHPDIIADRQRLSR